MTHIQMLDRDRCLELLRDDEIGRLAVLADGGPVIFPVNYRMDGESVVFRTDPGLKLEQGVRSHGCFEIDQFDRTDHRAGASSWQGASRRSPSTKRRRGGASTSPG